MEKIINALETNFDLLDFLFVQYKIPNKKEDNFFFNSEYIEKKEEIDLDFILRNQDKFDWEILCYSHYVPWLENIIDKNYNEINWYRICENKKIIWNEKLLNKYWDKLLINSIISNSSMFWNEKLVRFIISKHQEDSTKIFWLEKFSTVKNIEWNLQMIMDFPTSNWVKGVAGANTLKLSFEDLITNKKLLPKEVLQHLQVSEYLFWTIEMISEFKELLNFQTLSKSKNVNWSNELISSFCEELDFEIMSSNKSIPLDKSIINEFKNRWNFESLSSNSNVKWSVELLKDFISDFDLNIVLQHNVTGINEKFIHTFRDCFDWGKGCCNSIYNPAPIARYPHIPISVQTLVEKAINWETGFCQPYWDEKGPYESEWHKFSSNKFLTSLHLEKFADKLSWEIISSNEYLTITTELLLKHSNKWIWAKVLNRDDFKSEHFFAIHQYLNFELLNANSHIIFRILEFHKNTIFTHIKDNVEIASDFRHSLRSPNYRRYNEYENEAKQLLKVKRELIIQQCKRANSEHGEINNYDERYGIDAQKGVFYNKIHYWLREYFNVFEEISHVNDSFERERGYTPEIEIQIFFNKYLMAEEDFKKNYFKVYRSDQKSNKTQIN